MAGVEWIKIYVDMFDDDKFKIIETLPEKDAISMIWIRLLCKAGKTNDEGSIYINKNIPITDEVLAAILNRPLNVVRLALETLQRLEMIEVCTTGNLRIRNWERYQNIEAMNQIREKNRIRQQSHRDRQKALSYEGLEAKSHSSHSSEKPGEDEYEHHSFNNKDLQAKPQKEIFAGKNTGKNTDEETCKNSLSGDKEKSFKTAELQAKPQNVTVTSRLRHGYVTPLDREREEEKEEEKEEETPPLPPEGVTRLFVEQPSLPGFPVFLQPQPERQTDGTVFQGERLSLHSASPHGKPGTASGEPAPTPGTAKPSMGAAGESNPTGKAAKRTADRQFVCLGKKNAKVPADMKDDIMEVFHHWNSIGVIKHTDISGFAGHIKMAIEIYGKEEILAAITNYGETFHSPETYWTYKWGLDKFLVRKNSLDEFRPENFNINDYVLSAKRREKERSERMISDGRGNEYSLKYIMEKWGCSEEHAVAFARSETDFREVAEEERRSADRGQDLAGDCDIEYATQEGGAN